MHPAAGNARCLAVDAKNAPRDARAILKIVPAGMSPPSPDGVCAPSIPVRNGPYITDSRPENQFPLVRCPIAGIEGGGDGRTLPAQVPLCTCGRWRSLLPAPLVPTYYIIQRGIAWRTDYEEMHHRRDHSNLGRWYGS
jgi:hypothetical protein